MFHHHLHKRHNYLAEEAEAAVAVEVVVVAARQG
jgi:hypothetical protein